MSGTGEVVALAEGAVDLAELGLVAQTLVAAALSSPAADLLSLGLPAVAEVHGAGLPLLALAAGAQVARLTVTSPTVIRTCKARIPNFNRSDHPALTFAFQPLRSFGALKGIEYEMFQCHTLGHMVVDFPSP